MLYNYLSMTGNCPSCGSSIIIYYMVSVIATDFYNFNLQPYSVSNKVDCFTVVWHNLWCGLQQENNVLHTILFLSSKEYCMSLSFLFWILLIVSYPSLVHLNELRNQTWNPKTAICCLFHVSVYRNLMLPELIKSLEIIHQSSPMAKENNIRWT